MEKTKLNMKPTLAIIMLVDHREKTQRYKLIILNCRSKTNIPKKMERNPSILQIGPNFFNTFFFFSGYLGFIGKIP